VAADDAYICGERIITPWPGRNLSKEKDDLTTDSLALEFILSRRFVCWLRAGEYSGGLCEFRLGRLDRQ
jgi:hypothetical protein